MTVRTDRAGVVGSLRMLVVVALLAAACGADEAATGPRSPAKAATSEADCPVTMPPEPGFVPPPPYPPRPPDLYKSVWYGTGGLWTMLRPEGEVWQGLPERRGKFTQKTFWWSEDFSPGDESIPSILVTGQRLDREGSYAAEGPATNGSREDIGAFILVGIEVPAGCWELTALYGDAELSYVVSIEP